MPDLSIYKNIKGFNDYNAAAQQQGLANALAIAKLQQLQNPNSGMTPAALQIANEYRLARETGDTDRMKDIELFTKAYDKGLVTGENGIEALQGYGQAAGGIAAQKAGATEAAKLQQQLGYKPSIEQAVATEKNKAELEFAPQIEVAKKKATDVASAKQSISTTTPLIQKMLDLNEKTLDVPYLDATQGTARILSPEAANAYDEMQQARITLAAPLAKELGVNPTDKDFQASLDRIFNFNSTKEGRKQQILNLLESNQNKANTFGLTTPSIEPSAPKLLTADDLPKIGQKVDGMIFLGGDPSKPKNWK